MQETCIGHYDDSQKLHG